MNLFQSKEIELKLETVYEWETNKSNWDASFIESLYNQYYDKGGLTQKQLDALEKKYNFYIDYNNGPK